MILLLRASIFTVCEILDFIWTFLIAHTGGRIPGTLTRSLNSNSLWDSGFYMSLSHRIKDFWVCGLEYQILLSVRSWILSEPFSLLTQVGGYLGLLLGASIRTVCEILDFIWIFLSVLTGGRIPGSVTWSFNPDSLWDPRFHPAGCGYSVEREASASTFVPGSISRGSWFEGQAINEGE